MADFVGSLPVPDMILDFDHDDTIDIIKSNILNHNLNFNILTIKKNGNNTFWIWHIFSNKDTDNLDNTYSGRLRRAEATLNDFVLDNANRTLVYITPEWEDEDDNFNIINDVKITIEFTKHGWRKLLNILYDNPPNTN